MTPVPLRQHLLYDPLILALLRRLRSGEWGSVGGGNCSAVVASPDVFFDLCVFWRLFLGIPRESVVLSDASACLARLFFVYDGFAFSLEASFVPAVVPAPGVAFSGSLSCSRAFVEFRFGAERMAAYAPSEEERYRIVFPEGDGAYYRSLDEAQPDGSRLLTDEADAAAIAWASGLLGSRFKSFPGGR